MSNPRFSLRILGQSPDPGLFRGMSGRHIDKNRCSGGRLDFFYRDGGGSRMTRTSIELLKDY